MTVEEDGAPSFENWDWADRQAEEFEASGGTRAGTIRGVPIVVVSCIGARSGRRRHVALMRVEHGGEYALVASKGGNARNPGWYHSIVKNPEVFLRDGAVRKAYRAREVAGAERELWWERAVRVWPDYADYARSTERTIPVFVLTPSEG